MCILNNIDQEYSLLQLPASLTFLSNSVTKLQSNLNIITCLNFNYNLEKSSDILFIFRTCIAIARISYFSAYHILSYFTILPQVELHFYILQYLIRRKLCVHQRRKGDKDLLRGAAFHL